MPQGKGTYGTTKGRPPAKPVKKPKKKQMWSSPLELYPVHVSSLAPTGMAYVIEPQVSERINVERYSVVNVTGIDAYRQRPISQNFWVA